MDKIESLEQLASTFIFPEPVFVDCPNCGENRRDFQIKDGKCDICNSKEEFEKANLTPTIAIDWPEVRHRRRMLLFRSDPTQLDDYPQDIKSSMQPIRQELRDITKKPDPASAWIRMDEIEAQIPK